MVNVYYFSASLSPLNDYWILKELLSQKVNIKVVDIYDLINERDIDTAVENSQVEIYQKCDSEDELEKIVQSINFGDIAFVPTIAGICTYLRNSIAMKGAKVVCDTTFSLPQVSTTAASNDKLKYPTNAKKLKKIKWLIKQRGIMAIIHRALEYVQAKLPLKLSWHSPHSIKISSATVTENTFLITSGAKNHLSYKHVKTAMNHVKVGHYCTILRERPLDRIEKLNYWVFIDQALPFHRDAKRLGYDYDQYSGQYFAELEAFFHKIESITGKPVIVALHPRTENNYGNHFAKFKTYKGLTEELIEYSDGIITHFSTCIYSAVYLKKPIIFFTNTLMNKHHDIDRVYDFAARLNSDVLTTELLTAQSIEKSTIVDSESYDQFQENYIKQSDTKDQKAIDIIREKFKI